MQHISHCTRMIKEYTKVPHGFHLAQSFLVELTLNQSVTYRYREFFIFLLISEPVSEQIGTGKKSRNRYRKNLVPEKSLGTGIGTNLIPELIFVAQI